MEVLSTEIKRGGASCSAATEVKFFRPGMNLFPDGQLTC